MIIETLGLSLLIGKLRGGNIRNLGKLHIKGWYLFFMAFLIEIISILITTRTNGIIGKFIINNFLTIHIIIYILIIISLILNIRGKGIIYILIGMLLNFMPILANNGKMPVSVRRLANSYLYSQLNLLKDNRILTHTLVTENTRFYYLSDIISIPKPYPFPKIISIGDIIIGIGIFILIQFYMKYDFKPVNTISFINNRMIK